MEFGNSYTTNLKEGIFVEKLPTECNNTTTKGLALSETSGWFSYSSCTYVTNGYPLLARSWGLGYELRNWCSGWSYF
jgi:hypothetical protein